jgi:hypothetical protein
MDTTVRDALTAPLERVERPLIWGTLAREERHLKLLASRIVCRSILEYVRSRTGLAQ